MSSDRSRVVIAAVDDLFFSARIESAARKLGIRFAIVTDFEQLSASLKLETPDLVILDLNSRACAPLDTIRLIKSDPSLSKVRTLGFFSHVQVDLQRAAKEAGCDQVVSRSAFSAKLPHFLQ
jgi:PleD family two-component response regulator